jgi:hypothetical protein
LLTGSIQEVFSIFEPSDVPRAASHQSYQASDSYTKIRRNALLVQGLQSDTDSSCVLCGDRGHAAARCQHLRGLCFQCGQTGHSSKACSAVFEGIREGFCFKCGIPTFEVAGKMLHSGDIGQLCSHKHKDNIKMMLLTGLVMGEKFGPCTYRERIAWAAEGSPPNIVNLLARLVEMRQQKIVKR